MISNHPQSTNLLVLFRRSISPALVTPTAPTSQSQPLPHNSQKFSSLHLALIRSRFFLSFTHTHILKLTHSCTHTRTDSQSQHSQHPSLTVAKQRGLVSLPSKFREEKGKIRHHWVRGLGARRVTRESREALKR